MIEIRIPKEINDYKEKLFLGLTLRQTICIALLLGINIPAFFLLNPLLGIDVTGWIMIINAAPICIIGFVRPSGMAFEEFARMFLVTSFIYPPQRPYKTENLFEELADIIREEKEKEHLDEFMALKKAADAKAQEETKALMKARKLAKKNNAATAKTQNVKSEKVKSEKAQKVKPEKPEKVKKEKKNKNSDAVMEEINALRAAMAEMNAEKAANEKKEVAEDGE